MDSSMHAAQNERLPATSGCCPSTHFFEQVKASAGVRSLSNNNNSGDASRSTTNTDEECEMTIAENCRALKKQMSQMRIKGDELRKNGKLAKKNSKNSRSGMQLLPSRSRRIFDKLWAVGKGHGDNRSSETSGRSQSPTSLVPGDTKSSASASRHRSIPSPRLEFGDSFRSKQVKEISKV
ncbi:hypothetical protein FH972_013054 [Carpinus fangiana]|uniref:Uncharacterized protein n=1 Tax=Carpinus fangiana TaxID=176857 RepID=A0A5N6R8X0_9ROSI|nr:hypothetical protein FH972_013054 [Carpinus fangiana]